MMPTRHCVIWGSLLFFSLITERVSAQLSIIGNNTYTISFESTTVGVNSGPYAGTGFQALPSAGQLDSDAWSIRWSPMSSLPYGGTQTTDLYAEGAAGGPVIVGGFYAFSGGNITTGMALGIQPDGNGFNAPGEDLTLRIRNDTGHFITGFDASYLLYVRNDQGRSTKFNFSYSTSVDDLSYTSVQALNHTSPTTLDSNGFVSYAKSASIPDVAVPSGGYFYVRWSCSDGAGSGLRDEFALDDITVKNFTLADGIPTRGDVNQDNSINVADVRFLMQALADLDAFQAAHQMLTQSQISLMLNIDQEHGVDNLDVQALLNLLANSSAGGGQLQAVPEPAAAVIGLWGALLAIIVVPHRRRTCRAASVSIKENPAPCHRPPARHRLCRCRRSGPGCSPEVSNSSADIP